MNIGVYLVTDPVLCGTRGVVDTVQAAVNAGVETVQIRDKTTTRTELLEQIQQVAEVIDGRAKLLVNDHLDLVVDARRQGIPIDGVHLGQSDTSMYIAREQLGPNAIIGLSASTDEHLHKLGSTPGEIIDYVGVGAIRATKTKPDYSDELGIDGFARFVQITKLPAVAIGGVVLDDVAALRKAGAAGIAVVSAICAAEDPHRAAVELVKAWNDDAPIRKI